MSLSRFHLFVLSSSKANLLEGASFRMCFCTCTRVRSMHTVMSFLCILVMFKYICWWVCACMCPVFHLLGYPFLCCYRVKALECVLWRVETRLLPEALKLTWQGWRQEDRKTEQKEELLYPNLCFIVPLT